MPFFLLFLNGLDRLVFYGQTENPPTNHWAPWARYLSIWLLFGLNESSMTTKFIFLFSACLFCPAFVAAHWCPLLSCLASPQLFS